MEKHAFGERLKREREMRGVSLEEIAAATRISTRFLTALENEEWDRLPGGVFNRGFVRAVARFLGLDEEGLVADYATTTNDQLEAPVWMKSVEQPRRAVWPWVTALLLVALIAGAWFAYRRYQPRLAAGWKLRHPAATATAPPTPPAPVSITPAPATPPETKTPPGRAAPVATAVSPPAGFVEPAALELKVEAGKTTRVTVVADGKRVFDGQLIAGERPQFRAKKRFYVTAQDPSAILLELNGQTIPPLGPPEQQASVTLTRKDLKKPSP